MARIIPIPTTRVGDLFIRQRLSDQIHNDQLDLFNLQNQISTGQRLQVPSDDASAALRAINLQRLLARKGQVQTNIQSSTFYLNSAANALSSLSGPLAELRGEVIGTAGTLTTDEQRQAVIQAIDGALQDLLETANTKAQGRYLFSGSRTVQAPYAFKGQFVEYNGNDGDLSSYVDLNRLFETNVPGTDVFGGISTPVEGTADLNPHLSADTLLRNINAGAGIGKNAAITLRTVVGGNPAVTSVVDLSGAVTIGEVARLIEEAAPTSAQVAVDVTGTGLVIRSATGTVSIDEVAQGRGAHELGIFTGTTSPASTITGGDLDPAVTKSTRVADLLGTKAQGRVISTDPNNDLVLTANQNGAAYNGVTVNFVSGLPAGSEAATYDSNTNTLTVQIEDGVSSAAQVAAAISAEGTFRAALDYRDATSSIQAGVNPVSVASFASVTSGGGGTTLDSTSGLILTNGGQSVKLDISGATTVEDLLNLVNGLDLGLKAEINAAGTGLNIRSRWSGADLSIGENGGTTATQLGIRSYTGATQLAEFKRGVGVETADDPANNDLLITARDGTQLSINLSTAKTVQDVIDLINTNAANNTGTTAVVARLATTGNGIELVDSSTVTTGALTIQTAEGSKAAELLGFIPDGQAQATANTPDANGDFVLKSDDRHTIEVDSIFNSLLRLRTALESGDPPAIGRELDRFDAATSRITFANADIGSRLQNLTVVQHRLEDENVQLKSALSDDMDVDLVDAISNLTARQYAFEASLRTAATLLQTTLLNYI